MTRKILGTFLYVFLYVSKPKHKKNRGKEWKMFPVCFINKERKKAQISFITQLKVEFLLLFTGCRKVLGTMPDPSKISNSSHSWERGPNPIFYVTKTLPILSTPSPLFANFVQLSPPPFHCPPSTLSPPFCCPPNPQPHYSFCCLVSLAEWVIRVFYLMILWIYLCQALGTTLGAFYATRCQVY